MEITNLVVDDFRFRLLEQSYFVAAGEVPAEAVAAVECLENAAAGPGVLSLALRGWGDVEHFAAKSDGGFH